MLAFVYRPNKDEDDESNDEIDDDDLSRQLHSSVRTANVETSLRLLTLGADPNYFHPEKGTRAMHVAAKCGQDSQVELLSCYGGDPCAYDWEGLTAIQYARSAGHLALADRLIELQYELTDKLAHYVTNRKPDHMAGQHFIIPQMSDSLELSEFSKEAKRKLQLLPNELFEDLAMDVYDEVDRRHTDEVWQSSCCKSTSVDRCLVPFLPVNPDYSRVRNQGRQKLGRLNTREFTFLIIDVLSEAKRPKPLLLSELNNKLNDDSEPLYDSVASDDECPPAIPTSVPNPNQQQRHQLVNQVVGKHLALAEAKIQQLLDSNKGMKYQIDSLNTVVAKLVEENCNLRKQVDSVIRSSLTGSDIVPNGHGVNSSSISSITSSQRLFKTQNQRPQSMYESRDQIKTNNNSITDRSRNVSCSSSNSATTAMSVDEMRLVLSGSTSLPSQTEALTKTRPITQRIQELHCLAREQRQDSYVSCAEKIHAAVLEMAGIFPEDFIEDSIKQALNEVRSTALKLHTNTKSMLTGSCSHYDHNYIAQEIVKCAYDTTKAIKSLVTLLR
ncbi:hypothetical protein CHUAL_006004 [Chamberlinius hualienensis]